MILFISYPFGYLGCIWDQLIKLDFCTTFQKHVYRLLKFISLTTCWARYWVTNTGTMQNHSSKELRFFSSGKVSYSFTHSISITGTSLVAQWLRIRLPMQWTRVRPLVHGATKPVYHNYWACVLEPASHNYWCPRATTTEARAPRARAPQQEKPPQREARAPQGRVAPLAAIEKARVSNEDPTQPKISNFIFFLKCWVP